MKPTAICPVPDESRLVRYRFESPDDLYRHLRVKEGFFVPAIPGEPGERAMVEIDFPGAADRPLLHGRIRERAGRGAFLSMPTAHATARWMPGPDAPRRQARRVACDLFIELRPRESPPWVCRVADLSARGLRVESAAIEGVAGDEVSAILLSPGADLPSAELQARLAWVLGREAGLAILGADASLLPLLAAAEARWDGVEEIVHGAACVCGGTPFLRAS